MSRTLRALLVGCGAISDRWIKDLALVQEIELVGLLDVDEQKPLKLKKKHGLTHVAAGSNLEAMLIGTKPDVVFDLTPPDNRVRVLKQALAHDCHVLSEKPMAPTLAEAHEMISLADAADKTYAVIQNRRFDPSIRRFSRVAQAGPIGKLTTVHCDFFVGAHIKGFQDHMTHPLLLDMAIHTFDQARLITGEDAVSVYCHEWNPAESWFDHNASAIAIFEMTNGVTFCYRGSWCSEGFRTSWQSEWRLIGSQGTARWDGENKLACEVVDKQEAYFSDVKRVPVARARKSDRTGGHAGVIRDFATAVLSGATPETVGSDNLKSLAMVFAAIKSAGLKAPVIVDY